MYLLSQAQASALPRSNNCTGFLSEDESIHSGCVFASQLLTIARSGSNQTMNFAPTRCAASDSGLSPRGKRVLSIIQLPTQVDQLPPEKSGPPEPSYQPASSQNTSGTMPNCL